MPENEQEMQQVLPLDYMKPFDMETLTIDTYLDLIAQSCAALYVQDTPESEYQCIFNTYKFDEMGAEFHSSIIAKYKFSLEQRRRNQIAENHDIIKNKNYHFMILYMYPLLGYKVIAVRTADGTYEFGAYASPEYLESISKMETYP